MSALIKYQKVKLFKVKNSVVSPEFPVGLTGFANGKHFFPIRCTSEFPSSHDRVGKLGILKSPRFDILLNREEIL